MPWGTGLFLSVYRQQSFRTMGKPAYRCPKCRAGPCRWSVLNAHFDVTGHGGPKPYRAIQCLCVVQEPVNRKTWSKDMVQFSKDNLRRSLKKAQGTLKVLVQEGGGSKDRVDAAGDKKRKLKSNRALNMAQTIGEESEETSAWSEDTVDTFDVARARTRINRALIQAQQMAEACVNRSFGNTVMADAGDDTERAAREKFAIKTEGMIVRNFQRSNFDALFAKVVAGSGGRMHLPFLARSNHIGAGESLFARAFEKYLAGYPHLFSISNHIVKLTQRGDTSTGAKPVACSESSGSQIGGQDTAADPEVDKARVRAEIGSSSSSTGFRCDVDQDLNRQPPSAPTLGSGTDAKTDRVHEVSISLTSTSFSAPGSASEIVKPSHKRERVESQSSGPPALSDWLLGLDNGGGIMLQYLDALLDEFDGDLMQVSAAWNGKSVGKSVKSVIDCIDPCFWDAVGVRRLGHKYLFAHGIAKLVSQTGE